LDIDNIRGDNYLTAAQEVQFGRFAHDPGVSETPKKTENEVEKSDADSP
jgi:hypothetical protein